MKNCIKCKLDKLESEFYKHKETKDGLLSKCKTCCKAYARANYDSEKQKVYDASRLKNPERQLARKLAGRRLRKNDPGRVRVIQERYDTKYPKRKKANNAVGNAVRDGRLMREPCEVCGELKTEGHHDDYNKPLDVRWLCQACHVEWHLHNEPID